ncbi:hypothetical protein [Sulfuriflexus sp.]|uniref:hypothetical protein n=1 Tax=Sulfuriflexus sp. TaxID=2015443 RepID=UPI0028CFC3D3|nr:hypothetical protein [Sulfuriflexus sp.]MDT8405583.1 hypothetical protein [Sulfuriflexus sp.]
MTPAQQLNARSRQANVVLFLQKKPLLYKKMTKENTDGREHQTKPEEDLNLAARPVHDHVPDYGSSEKLVGKNIANLEQ